MDETLQQVRSAKIDVDVVKAMQEGQKLVDDLRSKASLEDFQDLIDKQREVQDERDEIAELMKEVGVSDAEVEKDLFDLEAQLAQEELPEVPKNPINTGKAKQEVKEKPKLVIYDS